MGSPITFSGFNSIDFNMILNAVMAQERQPITRLETQRQTLESQNSQYGTLAGKLATLESAAEALKAAGSLALLKASSSDTGVGVSATTGTVTGTYDIVVSELAKAQVTTSNGPGFASTTATFASGGTLTLTPSSGDPVEITVTAGTTLQQLAIDINADENSPASASIVQVSPGDYRLVLTGRETGTANAFTIASTVSELSYPATNTQDALDASFTVNGLAVTSSSNTVTDVIAGATLTLSKKDPSTTVTVTVSRDDDEAKALINKYITAYNDLQQFAKDQEALARNGRASIGREPLMRGLRDALRSVTMNTYAGGPLTRLAEIGVGFDQTGKMVLDETLFKKKIAASPTDVQTLLSGASGEAGVFGAITAKIESFTQTGGLLSSSRQRIDEQVSALGKRLDTLEAQLAIRRAALQREYMAADLAMTRLKSQSASLSSVGSSYRLF